MSHALARDAIERKIFAWAATYPAQVYYGTEKADAKIPVYMRCHLMPATTTSPYLHNDGTHFSGLYQVTISCDPSTKNPIPDGLVQALTDLFPVNSELESGGFSGIIPTPVDRGPTIVDDNRYNVPVTIPYRGEVSI